MAAFGKVSLVFLALISAVRNSNSQQIEDFLATFNQQAPVEADRLKKAAWQYETKVTNHTQKEREDAVVRFAEFMLSVSEKARAFDQEDVSEDVKRQLMFLRDAPVLKDKAKVRKLAEITGQMKKIYTEARARNPETGKKDQALIPVLEDILAHSRISDDLLHAWLGWREATGPALHSLYKQYVELSKDAVLDTGNFDSMTDYWRSQYGMEDLESDLQDLWSDARPLYLELHAYVRFKLARQYPAVREGYGIPAHVLGSMWAQDWSNIYRLVEPYVSMSNAQSNSTLSDSVEGMVRRADAFFGSLRIPHLPESFYQLSLFADKPGDGREVVCDTSEWDFFSKADDGECDVRIKQCATASPKWLVSTHQQLAHAHYMLSYCDQPFIFRDGANPAFPEGIGGAVSLSVTTPRYLDQVGLLKMHGSRNETVINAMLYTALRHVVSLPFALTVHQWNRAVFDGNLRDLNPSWWRLRAEYQGIVPALTRPDGGFDAGSFYPIFSDTSYVRHFLGTILQFQFHRALCEADGFKGDFHECCIYNSSAAGEKIREMYKVGKSKPWRDVLQKMTGQRKFDVGPMLTYYRPLHLWLREQRCQINYDIGWDVSSRPTYDPCEELKVPHSTVPTTHSGVCVTRATAGSNMVALLWTALVCLLCRN